MIRASALFVSSILLATAALGDDRLIVVVDSAVEIEEVDRSWLADLGCLEGNEVDGRQVAIVGVSDEHVVPPRSRRAPRGAVRRTEPARNRISLLRGASCGPDGKGRELRLVSRAEGDSRISVEVEIRESLEDVDGSASSRTSRRRRVVAGGGTVPLGCSRVGKLVRDVTVVEASWLD